MRGLWPWAARILVEWRQVDLLEGVEGAIGHWSAGAPQRALFTAFGVLLGSTPVHVVAVACIDAAHVDALDGAGCGALETGLALERAGLVVEQDEAAAVAWTDVIDDFGVAHRQAGLEDLPHGEGHALEDGQPGDPVRPHEKYSEMMTMAPAVTKMFTRAAGMSHFQAKPIIWSMRTRG